MATITTLLEVPYLCRNHNRNIVLVFKVGHSLTHYLGLDGCTLSVLQERSGEFEREYEPWDGQTPVDFAQRYGYAVNGRSMIALSGAAHRVIRAILSNQSMADVDYPQPEQELVMPKEDSGFRKPEGAVAQVHGFLDKKIEAIKAGTVSRKELIDAMVAKELNQSTVVTQCGVWARNNGVNFARPAAAAETKKAVAAEARAAKKTGKSAKVADAA